MTPYAYPYDPQLVDNLASLPESVRQHDPAQLSWLIAPSYAQIALAFLWRRFPNLTVTGVR